MESTHTEQSTEPWSIDKINIVRLELAENGHDLPELADTMEEADARVAASRFLGAMRGVQKEWGANEAEYMTLADFQRRRHDGRQGPLERQLEWLHGAVKTLFGFMRPSGKKKSLNLIGGRVGMRAQTDELVVEDEDEVIAWVQANQVTTIKPIVRIKLVLDRTALRAYMEAHAKEPRLPTPPGTTLKARDDQFYATPAKD